MTVLGRAIRIFSASAKRFSIEAVSRESPKFKPLPEPGADRHSRRLGFLGADFRRTASSHFALGEIENAHRIALVDHLDQRAGASQFDVIRMRRDGQNIYVFHSLFTFFSSSRSSTWYLNALFPLMKTTGISFAVSFSPGPDRSRC